MDGDDDMIKYVTLFLLKI